MYKLAKIESPSFEEKKHMGEEEQYIDQPVVDDIKNNKILNKRRERNMYNYENEYGGLVCEAYENIMDDFEKEAARKDPDAYRINSRKARKLVDFVFNPYAKGGVTSGAEVVPYSKTRAGLGNIGAAIKNHPYIFGGSALGAAALAGGGAYLYNRHKKKQDADELADKAAAYFDEAQMIKEAAENDYVTACAYEDAALDILDELGYSEDYDREVCAAESKERIDRNYDYFTNNRYEQKLLNAQADRAASRYRRAELNDAIRVAKAKRDDEEVSRLKQLRSGEKGVRNRAILEGLNPIHNAGRALGRLATNPREALFGAIGGSIGGAHDMNTAYQKAYVDTMNNKLGK